MLRYYERGRDDPRVQRAILLRKLALEKEEWRRRCRANFLDWCIEALRVYEQSPARHHVVLINKLQALWRGDFDRLMIYMPPRHAKSWYTSRLFVPWFLAQDPTKSIIAASHTYNLAEGFGRFARNLITEHAEILGFSLEADRTAAGHWLTDRGGGYLAAGVGKAIAGNPGDLLLIDDPVSNKAEAESEVQRESVWNWYKNDLYTRQQPHAKIVLIMCMVGDTKVLLTDGSHKKLKDVRRGDKIATYENGIIGESIIEAWKSQGSDLVFEIQTRLGAITRANARHPFLVKRKGEYVWVRLRDLRVGDLAVRVNEIDPPIISGEHSAAYPVVGKIAKRLQNAKVFVRSITARIVGKEGYGLHHIIPLLIGRLAYAATTAWMRFNIKLCSQPKMAYARSADYRPRGGCPKPGIINFALTTITAPKKCADSFATTAISLLALQEMKHTCSLRWDISKGFNQSASSDGAGLLTREIILDRITSIVSAGHEEVFDVQVARTQNFIADGFISHNTRWHEDDLGGRLLNEMASGGDQWEILKFAALANDPNDPLGRDTDEALWPEWMPKESLLRIRRTMGEREFGALYQQDPRPPGGSFFDVNNILVDGQPIAAPPLCDTVFAVIDTAVKTGSKNDATGVTYYALCNQVKYHPLSILDWDITQIEGALLETWLPTVFKNLEILAEQCGARYGSMGVYIEDKASGIILLQQVDRRPQLGRAHPIDTKLTALGKDERAINASGYVQRQMVKITEHAYNKMTHYKGRYGNHFLIQVFRFQLGVKDQADDLLDTFTYGISIALGDSEGF